MKKICKICLKKIRSQGLLGHYRWKHNLSTEEAHVLITSQAKVAAEDITSQAKVASEDITSQAKVTENEPVVHTYKIPHTCLPMKKKEASKPGDPCDKDGVSFSFFPLDWGSESSSGDSSPLTFLVVAMGVLALGWVVLGRILKPEAVQEVGAIITSFADKFGVKT